MNSRIKPIKIIKAIKTIRDKPTTIAAWDSKEVLTIISIKQSMERATNLSLSLKLTERSTVSIKPWRSLYSLRAILHIIILFSLPPMVFAKNSFTVSVDRLILANTLMIKARLSLATNFKWMALAPMAKSVISVMISKYALILSNRNAIAGTIAHSGTFIRVALTLIWDSAF